MGRYFEDLTVGEQFITPRRTITESDVTAFAGLSGDYNALHTDAVGAHDSIFGARIAHGVLGLSIVTGLTARLDLFEGTVMALLNVNWNFAGPIYMGDTVHARVIIDDKRETSKPDRGIVVRRFELLNQHDKQVQEGTMTVMMKRRPRS